MSLVGFAYRNGSRVCERSSREKRKALGQFMTPTSIAIAMATRVCQGAVGQNVRILDPAAGAGILAAAVAEQLLTATERPKRIELVLYEIDGDFLPVLRSLARRLRHDAASAGVEVSVRIRNGDFLLEDQQLQKWGFDFVIANPPYFKIGKSDARAVKHNYAVHGQPNIYGLFIAATARMLRPGGRWCFISPRSWANGPYFAEVRREFFRWLRLDAIHVFESRREHFTDDEILQEAMITWATAQAPCDGTVLVSTSEGVADLTRAVLKALPISEVVANESRRVISLPQNERGGLLRTLRGRLSTYHLRVSTGPVVAFRALDFLSERSSRNTVPLLWMQHVDAMRIRWPIDKKREHIVANAGSAWMLVPNANMVVLRRFSPKEAARRITAAPYLAGSLPGIAIGLENHTNYVYRPGGDLSEFETKGLAAYLNSLAVDAFFRERSGNTQVNAADLRDLPIPPMETLIEIGRMLPHLCTAEIANEIVNSVLNLDPQAQVA